jgi:SAM-dependent methyltransferase
MGGPPDRTLPPDYFEAVYAANDDPWGFETSPYETAKYAATLAALPRARYADAFEIGCSLGVLSEQLAARCDRLLAVDVVAEVLARARARCRGWPQVRFARMRVPEQFPGARFDLVVVSEVGYYWSRADLSRARRRIVEALLPGGHLVLVHWTPFVHDYPLTGDEVHEAFLAEAGADRPLVWLHGAREETYRLDVFERR